MFVVHLPSKGRKKEGHNLLDATLGDIELSQAEGKTAPGAQVGGGGKAVADLLQQGLGVLVL